MPVMSQKLHTAQRAWRGCLALAKLALLVLSTGVSIPAQESAKATKSGNLSEDVAEVLSENGLRINGSNLALNLDSDVIKEVKELAKFKRALMLADRERYAVEAEVEGVKQRISELRKRHTILSAQLANVTDTVSNNRLVGELNTTAGVIEALGEQQTQLADKAKLARGKANEIREDFVKTLLELRQNSDRAFQKWESLAADKSVMAAVEMAASQTGKKLVVKPSAPLVAADRQLKSYEEAVISESIPLENERGNLWVNVVINGKPVERMVVDSGASAVSVSYELAKKLEIIPKETDPDVMVGLADGRRIPGKMVKLATVRVGKFTAENVECIVLGEQAIEAPPLLGMSFLGQFKFELDAAQSQLKMVKVDSGEPEPSSTRTKKKTK